MKEHHDNFFYFDHIPSEIGYWTVFADDKGLTNLKYSSQKPDSQPSKNKITDEASVQLSEYFHRLRSHFDLAFSLEKHTEFHKAVWKKLCQVPYGKTISYSDLAQSLNNPKAVRAVGTANGRNPIPIIIPCHRVIGKDKSLTGYASGLKVKRWLLELEGAIAHTPTLF